MNDFNTQGKVLNTIANNGIQSEEEIRADNGSGILCERRGALWSH